MPTFVTMKWTVQPTASDGASRALCQPTIQALKAAGLSEEQCSILKGREARGVKGWTSFPGEDAGLYARTIDVDARDAEGLHKLRQAGADLGKLLASDKVDHIHVDAGKGGDTVAEGVALNSYRYTDLLGKKASEAWTLKGIQVAHGSKDQADLSKAVHITRDLVNTPVWSLTAMDLADQAEKLGKDHGFQVTVLGKSQIESLKMGGLLAVNKGSIDPPRFIILEHKPGNASNDKPIVLVGKGVVYDTGGLSLKPSPYMEDMKCDMGGSAAVIGAFCAMASQGLNKHVIGLIPATDNRPGGNAVTPGDVITMMSGHTVEVLNTDAEGRLILADALHYAKKYQPSLVMDLATLTGAAARAIGRQASVAMGTASDTIMTDLVTSGFDCHERVVIFPFWDDYADLIKSEIADMKNIGGAEAGAVTAGKFLEHYTDYPYVHIDIAGPAFLDAPWCYFGKGATGVGVRLLMAFLNRQD